MVTVAGSEAVLKRIGRVDFADRVTQVQSLVGAAAVFVDRGLRRNRTQGTCQVPRGVERNSTVQTDDHEGK